VARGGCAKGIPLKQRLFRRWYRLPKHISIDDNVAWPTRPTHRTGSRGGTIDPTTQAQNRPDTPPTLSQPSKGIECPPSVDKNAPASNETTGSRTLSVQLSGSDLSVSWHDPNISVPAIGAGRTPVIAQRCQTTFRRLGRFRRGRSARNAKRHRQHQSPHCDTGSTHQDHRGKRQPALSESVALGGNRTRRVAATGFWVGLSSQ
jgi:hypothetical protein